MTPEQAAWFNDILSGVATAVMVILAGLGLNTWRKQLTGTADYELARRLLRSVYRVRDEITRTRSPMMSGGETAAAVSASGEKLTESNEEANKRMYEITYDARWRRLNEVISDFETDLTEAEVLWGAVMVEHARRMRKSITKLSLAIRDHLRARRREPTSDAERKLLFESKAILWFGGDENGVDAFGDEVTATIAVFEAFLRPKLSH